MSSRRRSPHEAKAPIATLALVLPSLASGCAPTLMGSVEAGTTRVAEVEACLEGPGAALDICLTEVKPLGEGVEDDAKACRRFDGFEPHEVALVPSSKGLGLVLDPRLRAARSTTRAPRRNAVDPGKELAFITSEQLRSEGAAPLLRVLADGSFTRGCLVLGRAAVTTHLASTWATTGPSTPKGERRSNRSEGATMMPASLAARAARFAEQREAAARARLRAADEEVAAFRRRVMPLVAACETSGAVIEPGCEAAADLAPGEREACRIACRTRGLPARLRAVEGECAATWATRTPTCGTVTELGERELTRCQEACRRAGTKARDAGLRSALDACLRSEGPAVCAIPAGSAYPPPTLRAEAQACSRRCVSERPTCPSASTPASLGSAGATTSGKSLAGCKRR
jgi:hypothetical protein